MDKYIIIISKDSHFTADILSALKKNLVEIKIFSSVKEAAESMSGSNYYIIILDQEAFSAGTPYFQTMLHFNFIPTLYVVSATPFATPKDRPPLSPEGVFWPHEIERLSHLVTDKLIRFNGVINSIDTMSRQFRLETKSAHYKKTLEFCKRVADSNANILLVGESGTGKEVAAKYIHGLSGRRSNNFVAVNCSAYTEGLLESELFGHEKGAFTGATKTRIGKFETANEGTLFLDEAGDISSSTQTKLLRVIESKETERIGSDSPRYIDFRLISATNRDLAQSVEDGTFRMDFFYRISTIVIEIPALRDRPEDLSDLISFFMVKSEQENKKKISKIDPEVVSFLHRYDYPGNIRELRNIIDRMVILSEDGVVTKDGLPLLFSLRKGITKPPSGASPAPPPLPEAVLPLQAYRKQTEAAYLSWVLKKTGSHMGETARLLQISPRQLLNKLNEYGLR